MYICVGVKLRLPLKKYCICICMLTLDRHLFILKFIFNLTFSNHLYLYLKYYNLFLNKLILFCKRKKQSASAAVANLILNNSFRNKKTNHRYIC